MKTVIKVNRCGIEMKRSVRVGIVRGKREQAIFLSEDSALRLADSLRTAAKISYDGEYGNYVEEPQG